MGQSTALENAVVGQLSSGGYAGDVSAFTAWEAVKNSPNAVLVDVRTQAEWNFVGVPDLSSVGKQPLLIEWQIFPTMELNASFVDMVIAAAPDKSAPLYFLCRSGARSKSAAVSMTQAGYVNCYNIAPGFEGPHDGAQHRGSVEGWKASDLPWVQG